MKPIICSDRTPMNAIIGICFVLFGYALIVYLMSTTYVSFALQIAIVLVVSFALFAGLFNLGCYFNRKIYVDDKEIVYVSFYGGRKTYKRSEVTITRSAGSMMNIHFDFGDSKQKFYGYSRGAKMLDDYLFETRGYANEDAYGKPETPEPEPASPEVDEYDLDAEWDPAWDEEPSEKSTDR